MDWSEIRHILKKIIHNRTFSFINIISLSIGIVCSILAFLYIQYELNVDRCFSNTKEVYRLTINNVPPATFHIGQPPVFFDEIIKEIPEIESGSRIFYDPVSIKIEDNRFKSYFLGVDSTFFNLIGWEMIVGNPNNVLSTPFSVIISESKAKQLFKDKNPIGQIINIDNLFDYNITGVFKDIPEQSHIRTDFFASLSSMQKRNDRFFSSWGNHSTAFYFKIQTGSDINLTNIKIAELWNKKSTDSNCTGDFVRSKLQAFSNIYLKSGYLDKNPGNIIYVLGIAIIASLILLISCFNFINLSMAISGKRNAETGIKKVLGANSRIFTKQILIEILIYISVALLISFVLVNLLLPELSAFTGKNMELTKHNYFQLIRFTLLLSLVIVLLVSIFPILQMFRLNAANVFNGTAAFSSKKSNKSISPISFRNVLVIIQFTIGIALILSAIVVNQQLRLIRQHDLGFDKEHVLVIRNDIGNRNKRFNILKNNLANNTGVKTLSSASHVPAVGLSNFGGPTVAGDENNTSKQCGLVSINHQYFKTVSSKFIFGRDFKQTITSDKDKIIINEALQKELGLKSPVGTKLITLRDKKEREIVGVIKDIEFSTIHSKNIPVIFFLRGNGFDTFSRYIVIKLQSAKLPKTIAEIKEEWKRISPNYPIEYFFLDDLLNQNYKSESQTAILMNILTMVAILLCCLGLFGLAIFNINGRIKEIGIRKVNGAKVSEILTMLNKDFIKWVAIAFVIACPIAYYVMNKWLENFAYKTTLSWWIFALAGVLALGIALLTVSWQSWRAATRNPVEALRYE